MVIAGSPSVITYLPHVASTQLDLYGKAGLDLEIESVNGGTHGVQALIGGSCDVVLGFMDHPMRVASQGQELRAFVALTRYPGNVVIVSPAASKPIRRIEDLKGATVGVSDIGSQNHHFINRVLVRNGLSTSDITPVAVGAHASALAALERGKIDVWSGFDPAAAAFMNRFPNTMVLADTRTEQGLSAALGTTEYPGSTLYSTQAWLTEHPEQAKKMAHAIVAALRWMQDHTPEELAALVPADVKGQDSQLYLQTLKNNRAIYSTDGVISAEGAKAVFGALKSTAANSSEYQFSPSRTYTNEFLR
jgi:NitT/TauT family transport system substrate-binding protein